MSVIPLFIIKKFKIKIPKIPRTEGRTLINLCNSLYQTTLVAIECENYISSHLLQNLSNKCTIRIAAAKIMRFLLPGYNNITTLYWTFFCSGRNFIN